MAFIVTTYIGHLFKLGNEVFPPDDIIYLLQNSCYHNCTTFTKPIQLSKKEFVSAFYVSTLSTNGNIHTAQLQVEMEK